jgi:hypothetical protein
MVCLWCGKKVGLLRSMMDREFCSQVHRKLASQSPDRIAKEIDVTADYDLTELWAVEKENRKQSRPGGVGQAIGVFLVLGLMAVVAVGMATGGAGGGSSNRPALPGLSPTASTANSTWSDFFRSTWRSHSQVTLTNDFSRGINDWVGHRNQGKHDWSLDPSGLRPGRIKIWSKSTSLSDYDMEFLGQIEQKSLGWAFRAADIKNYYGSKLVLAGRGAGGSPNAGLVRFITVDGREQERTQMPIPITLERGVPYRVRVSVEGSRFVTTVNGQVVSSWSDSRIRRGGVGFFSEDGDVSTVRWVSLTERDSMLGRLLSHFSLIQAPWLSIATGDDE